MMHKLRRLGVIPEKYLSSNLPRESPLNKLYTVPTVFLDCVIVHFITLTSTHPNIFNRNMIFPDFFLGLYVCGLMGWFGPDPPNILETFLFSSLISGLATN